MQRLLPIFLTVLLAGCASVPAPDPVVVLPAEPNVRAATVCTGLDAVDPAGYDGWAGECPGATVDAKAVFKLATSKGLAGVQLLDKQATWPNVSAKILERAKTLKRGDLLFLMFSGHGGQLPDDNGDEVTDQMDETLCLWDGQVRDDAVLRLIKQFPSGLRVVIINDQCHSEGNFRGMPVKRSRAIAMVRATGVTEWDGQLIQFAGCREADYSYGADDGGTWTCALTKTYRDGISWTGWFKAAAARMPVDQVPMWVEYGQVTAAFRNGEALK